MERNNLFAILLFVAVGFGLYANTLHNPMFWDDYANVVDNQFIKDWRYLPDYFSKNLTAGAGGLNNYWRPMLLLVYSLEWHLWQDWVVGYHLVDISFHIANAVFLFFVLFFIFKSRFLAFSAALIFLVHPLQTEAVTWITGLGDALSAFFIFLGILFYLKFRISGDPPLKSRSYLLSLIMYILALMSKEIAIIMPAFIFIVDFFFLGQNADKGFSLKEKLKKIGKALWPFLVLAGVYIVLRATILNFLDTFNLHLEENIFTLNFHVRLFTFLKVLLIYFGLLFWPFNLHLERSSEIGLADSFNSFPVILGGFIFLGLLVLAFSQFKRFPVLSFGILWFFIGLAPTSNLLVPVNGLLYEHWLYLPLIGIFLVLIWLGKILAGKYNQQKAGVALLAGFLIFLSILTVNRNKDWRDPVILYEQILKYSPSNYRATNNLGTVYETRGNYERAEALYQRAIYIDPFKPRTYYNLGSVYLKTGKSDLAVKNFDASISFNPKFYLSYQALAVFYMERGNYKEARRVLENYLRYSNSKVDILLSLARIAVMEGNLAEAMDYLKKASAINPENQVLRSVVLEVKNLLDSNQKEYNSGK